MKEKNDTEKIDRDAVIELLIKKYGELRLNGEDRYPRRSDFSEREAAAVKAHLGPWPRALEAAGLKPPRDGDRVMLNREKRLRAKRRRNEARKNQDNPIK